MTVAPEEPTIDRPEPRRPVDVREIVAAIILLVACGLVVAGAALLHPSAGFITGGVLLAGWSCLVLSE